MQAQPSAAADTPASRSGRGRVALLILLLLALGLALLAALWDWNWFKGPIERRVEAATGRRLEIGGDLDVEPGWRLFQVRVDDIAFANAPWSKTPEMARIERIELSLRPWPALLHGRFLLPQVRLVRPRVLLERESQGPGNWMLDRPARAGRFMLGQLLIDDGRLELHDRKLHTDLDLHLKSGRAGAGDALAPLSLLGDGTWRGLPFELEGTVESPLELRNRDQPYHVELRGRAGATQARARGEVSAVSALRDFDLAVELRGADLADLDAVADLVLPTTPPYRLDGRLVREGDTWRYTGFTGTVGDSDLAGDATVVFDGERPRLRAELVSKSLDFDDLAGFVNAPVSAAAGETASAEQQRAAAELAASDRLLPQRPYRLDKLRAMDADVTLRAERVVADSLPLESLQGHLVLQGGKATLDPFELGMAGGRLTSRIVLDASGAPIASDAELTLRGLQLPKLLPRAELAQGSAGRIGGRIELRGHGNSVAQMLATSDGQAGLVMGRGRISNLLLEFAGLDVAEALKFLLGKDRIIPLRCAHAAFAVQDGVATAERLVFDTTDTVLYGQGSIDLREETLALELRPQPKDKSLVSLRSPLQVEGSFKDPDIHPKAGPLALRGLAAAALYSIAPPAALLGLIETGPGEDSDCTPPPPRVTQGDDR
jgi:uncharacterized protein involved in outer membrane biogenesis